MDAAQVPMTMGKLRLWRLADLAKLHQGLDQNSHMQEPGQHASSKSKLQLFYETSSSLLAAPLQARATQRARLLAGPHAEDHLHHGAAVQANFPSPNGLDVDTQALQNP